MGILLSCVGSIIHTNKGLWIIKRSKPLGVLSNNLAKLEDLIKRFILSLELGIRKLVIEGDSQIIINALSKRSMTNWILNSKLEYVLKIVENFEEMIIEHIY